MFYGLKTRIMRGVVARRQRNRPFDYTGAETYSLPADADQTVNNSYYFSAHDTEKRESLYCRLGLRTCHSEVWLYYAGREGRFVLERNLFDSDAPLQISRSENGWRIAFDASVTGPGGPVRLQLNGEFTSDQPAVDFFSHMPPVRMAKAMAFEKWTRDYFAQVQSNNQVHYEQTGMLRGTLCIGGQERRIEMPCVRDHSFGKRDWNYMNNHLWMMAVNRRSQLNFSMVSYPAMTLLEVGNFKPDGAPMDYVVRASYDRAAVAAGSVTKQLRVTLQMQSGRTLQVNAGLEDVQNYPFQNGEYLLAEGVAHFEIDGVPHRGILEVGWNGAKERIYNGKKVEDLKE